MNRHSPFLNNNPLLDVALRYYKVLSTTCMCLTLGLCMNWLTTLAKFDLVRAGHINLPTSL